jgi:hypothetical protein
VLPACLSAGIRHAYALLKANEVALVLNYEDMSGQHMLGLSVCQGFMLRILAKHRGKNYVVVVRQDCNLKLNMFI